MSTNSSRAKARRKFQLEGLEDRNLLSVAPRHAIAAEVARASVAFAPITSIQARVTGVPAPNGLLVGTPVGYQSFSGHGNSNTVGSVYLGARHFATPNPTNTSQSNLTSGTAFLTTIKGDNVALVYTGITQLTRGRGFIDVIGNVTGGNGRFDGVTGTFTGIGTINSVGKFTMQLNIALIHPTV